MNFTQEHRDYLKDKIKELHDNVRHITQLGMAWFAFFVTINYLTIGWLAKAPASGRESVNSYVVLIVACIFILQNVLGVVGICMVNRAAKALAEQVKTFENLLLNSDNEVNVEDLKATTIPNDLYNAIANSLVTVLSLLIPAWLGVALLLFFSS